jgi:hypothetical protein
MSPRNNNSGLKAFSFNNQDISNIKVKINEYILIQTVGQGYKSICQEAKKTGERGMFIIKEFKLKVMNLLDK